MEQEMKTASDLQQVVNRVAQELLGYEQLRPGQEEAITAVLHGPDTLAVMPTGSGKSAIYQIAGALIPGATIVVSPLIALQRDQVEAIAGMDAGRAALVNSALPASERTEALDEFAEGAAEFLFLAPEQFANEETFARKQASLPSSSSTRPTALASGVMTSAQSTFASAPSSRRSAAPGSWRSPPPRRRLCGRRSSSA